MYHFKEIENEWKNSIFKFWGTEPSFRANLLVGYAQSGSERISFLGSTVQCRRRWAATIVNDAPDASACKGKLLWSLILSLVRDRCRNLEICCRDCGAGSCCDLAPQAKKPRGAEASKSITCVNREAEGEGTRLERTATRLLDSCVYCS